MAEKDTMTRKWQITINNPKDKGMTHEYIAQKVGEMKREHIIHISIWLERMVFALVR